MAKFLILKAGSTHSELERLAGDTNDWIINAIDRDLTFDTISLQNQPTDIDFSIYNGIFITGSHSNVTEKLPWMNHAHGIILAAISKHIPILGICFGHQLIADALGGNVDYHPVQGESGMVDITLNERCLTDALIRKLPCQFVVYAAHEQSVITLPSGAICLGGNHHERNHIVNFRPGVWGVQFHPEFTTLISNYYFDKETIPGNRGNETEYKTAQMVGKQVLNNFLTYCLT